MRVLEELSRREIVCPNSLTTVVLQWVVTSLKVVTSAWKTEQKSGSLKDE